MRTELSPFLVCPERYYYHIKLIRVQDTERGKSTQRETKYHQINYYV